MSRPDDRRGRGLCRSTTSRPNGSRSTPRVEGLARLAATRSSTASSASSRATEDDSKWVVWQRSADRARRAPISTTARRSTLTEFYTTRPELVGAPLQPMHPLEIPARDGLTLVSYLTLPPGSDPDGDGVPTQPVPMVLLVHGGPWARDGWGFNRAHQWLANRGYAVLSVNFRGSTGFGKEFVNAGNREWGAQDARRPDRRGRLGRRRRASPQRDKVAIMGGSYGGYATLVGPDLHARGVRLRRRHRRPVEPRDAARDDPAVLGAAWSSSSTSASATRTRPRARPLLIDRSPLHTRRPDRAAAADRPGRQRPARQAGRERPDRRGDAGRTSIPVTYVLFPDEGHGFASRPTTSPSTR